MNSVSRSLIVALIVVTVSTAGANEKKLTAKETLWHKYRGIVGALAVSPTGSLVAVAARSDSIELWTFPEGKKVATLSVGKRSFFRALEFSPDGGELTAAFGEYLLRWDPRQPEIKVTEKKLALGEGELISAIAYSEDGTMFAATAAKKLLIWDRKSNAIKHTYPLGDQGASRILFSRDSKFVVAALSGSWNLQVWQLGVQQPKATLKGHGFRIAGIVMANHGRVLVSGGWDEQVIFWDVENGKIIAKYEMEERVSAISANTDGTVVAVATYGNGVHLFDTKKMEKTRIINEADAISATALSGEGDFLLLGYGHWLPGDPEKSGRLTIQKLAPGKK